MATVPFGHIREFDSSKEEWLQYEERLGHFFVANGTTNADKKRAVFLSIIGASTYKLLHNLISPSKPGDKSYAELTAALRKHFHPTPSVIVERFRLWSSAFLSLTDSRRPALLKMYRLLYNFIRRKSGHNCKKTSLASQLNISAK